MKYVHIDPSLSRLGTHHWGLANLACNAAEQFGYEPIPAEDLSKAKDNIIDPNRSSRSYELLASGKSVRHVDA